MLKRSSTALAVLFASSCLLHAPAARADSFNFTITTPANQQFALTGSGTIVTTDAGNGTQYITSITGTIDNSANTNVPGTYPISLIPTSAPGQVSEVSYGAQNNSTFYFYYDNVLTPNGATPLDSNGLAFNANGVSYDIGYLGSQAEYDAIAPNQENFDQHTYNGAPIDFTITPAGTSVTPEPSSFALLGTGLLGMAGVVRRRISA